MDSSGGIRDTEQGADELRGQLAMDYQARIAGLRRASDRASSRAARHARWEQVIDDADASFPWRGAVGAMGAAVCGAIAMGFCGLEILALRSLMNGTSDYRWRRHQPI